MNTVENSRPRTGSQRQQPWFDDLHHDWDCYEPAQGCLDAPDFLPYGATYGTPHHGGALVAGTTARRREDYYR